MNSFNWTNVGNSIIKAIPAPEAKAPLSRKIANAIPTIKGPIVWLEKWEDLILYQMLLI